MSAKHWTGDCAVLPLSARITMAQTTNPVLPNAYRNTWLRRSRATRRGSIDLVPVHFIVLTRVHLLSRVSLNIRALADPLLAFGSIILAILQCAAVGMLLVQLRCHISSHTLKL